MNIILAILGSLLIAVAIFREATATNTKLIARKDAQQLPRIENSPTPPPESKLSPKDEQPSLSDKIQSLSDHWESRRKSEQEFHNENYVKHAAIIAQLMELLGQDRITVGNKIPEGLSVWMDTPETGQIQITLKPE
jgi:hypothetical protein